MDWKKLGHYFEDIPKGFASSLLLDSEYPWSALEGLQKKIEAFFKNKTSQGVFPGKKSLVWAADGSLMEGGYWIEETLVTTEALVDCELKIYIEAGVYLEAGSTIKNHSILDQGAQVRQGAYIRGSVYVGPDSVVGHATEVKNSILIRHVEAGHFAYIGDSILGSMVNLGAGTKISNLQFRSLEDKQQMRFPLLPFSIKGQKIEHGRNKMGAIIGDGVEIGCNCVLSPFVLLMRESWVLPNLCVPKGVYGQGSRLFSLDDCKKSKL